MKKIFLSLLAIFLLLSVTTPVVAAQTFDLSGMSYDELVALKDQLNLAMWNSEEWQEVTVPHGVWEIGVDIPAGHWTISADPSVHVMISYGDKLEPNGKSIAYSPAYYATSLLGSNRIIISSMSYVDKIDLVLENGHFLVIEDGCVIFTPYSGKPDLGFK